MSSHAQAPADAFASRGSRSVTECIASHSPGIGGWVSRHSSRREVARTLHRRSGGARLAPEFALVPALVTAAWPGLMSSPPPFDGCHHVAGGSVSVASSSFDISIVSQISSPKTRNTNYSNHKFVISRGMQHSKGLAPCRSHHLGLDQTADDGSPARPALPARLIRQPVKLLLRQAHVDLGRLTVGYGWTPWAPFCLQLRHATHILGCQTKRKGSRHLAGASMRHSATYSPSRGWCKDISRMRLLSRVHKARSGAPAFRAFCCSGLTPVDVAQAHNVMP